MRVPLWNALQPKIKVDGNRCWLWVAGKDGCGYGTVMFRGKVHRAHRVSYILHVGEIQPGMVILHICDNPACVNPDHLRLGTQADNVKDCETKGRGNHPAGENCGKSKLTLEQVRLIRSLHREGKRTYAELAKEFKTSKSNIGYILSGDTWREMLTQESQTQRT